MRISSQEVLRFLPSWAYFILLKNAMSLEGNENIQTNKVTAAENSTINGQDKMKKISKTIFPTVIGLLRFGILLN